MLGEILADILLSSVGLAAVITVIAVLAVFGGDRALWALAFALIFLAVYLYTNVLTGGLAFAVAVRLALVLAAALAILTTTAAIRAAGTLGGELGDTGRWVQRVLEALVHREETEADALDDFDDWVRSDDE